MIRRLSIPADEPLIRSAYRWDGDRPRWYREADAVFNSGTEDDFVARAATAAYLGVFDNGELIGLVIVEMPTPRYHEGHLCARRGASSLKLTVACVTIVSDLLNLGMTQLSCWVAERNTSVRKICATIGLQPDGVVMWRGSHYGRAIKWVRYSIRRDQQEITTQVA